jgi:hypothetical protein
LGTSFKGLSYHQIKWAMCRRLPLAHIRSVMFAAMNLSHRADLRILQIARVKPVGEPAVDPSDKFASLIPPELCKTLGGAQSKAKLRRRRLHAPVASDKHFLVKLVFAAPCSF